MRSSTGRRAAALAAVAILGFTAACGAGSRSRRRRAGPPASAAASPQDLQPATLIVPDALKGTFTAAPGARPRGLDDVAVGRRTRRTPGGLDARRRAARVTARRGQVVRLTPDGATATSTVLLDGLTQPHGLAFDGTTLYVAESDRIGAYTYAAGAATGQRIVADGLPDAKSAELGGAVRARAEERDRRP